MDITNGTNSTSIIQNDECFLTDEQIKQSYNLPLHIVSVFVLLIVSFLGASISVASARVKCLHINPIIINTGKFFGSGVVLATGFIHILPDAMATLTDPCLPDSWNVYGAYGGLFAMLSALGMQLIEFLAHQRYRSSRLKHSHLTAHIDRKECIKTEIAYSKGDEAKNKEQTNNEADKPTCIVHEDCQTKKLKKKKPVNNEVDHIKDTEQNNENAEEHQKEDQIIGTKGKSKKKKSVNAEGVEPMNSKIEEPEEIQQTSDKSEKLKRKKQTDKKGEKSEHLEEAHNHNEHAEDNEHNDCVAIEILHIEPTVTPLDLCEESAHYHGAAFQDNGEDNTISTYLLELGIALHSVLIGLTLGTTTESFVALFIALCFHQFFEAIALGAQIANLKTTSIKSAIHMIIFFSLTTPVGIAIGIGIHSGTYNPKSVSSLLVTGILDSLSAGVLIYVALVNLITAEMGANAHAFYSLSTRLKFLYFIALYLGAAAMAVIGRWA